MNHRHNKQKNTALLSIKIVEAIPRKYLRLQLELNFFLCKTGTETYTRHMDSVYYTLSNCLGEMHPGGFPGQ